MDYQHSYFDGTLCSFPVGKVVCVGRNYYEHIKELNNPVPTEPLLFIKPATSLRSLSDDILLPDYSTNCHHETELSILFGKKISKVDKSTAEEAINAYGLALDLTLRDVQQQLKEKGYPWEIAKGFDGSCPISPFITKDKIENPQNTMIKLTVNGEIKQQASTSLMITKILDLIVYVSKYFTLMPGDVLLTGTPAGVSPLQTGDRLELELAEKYKFETSVR